MNALIETIDAAEQNIEIGIVEAKIQKISNIMGLIERQDLDGYYVKWQRHLLNGGKLEDQDEFMDEEYKETFLHLIDEFMNNIKNGVF